MLFDEDLNKFITGPETKVVKIAHFKFPFLYNQQASIANGIVCNSISGDYDKNIMLANIVENTP